MTTLLDDPKQLAALLEPHEPCDDPLCPVHNNAAILAELSRRLQTAKEAEISQMFAAYGYTKAVP